MDARRREQDDAAKHAEQRSVEDETLVGLLRLRQDWEEIWEGRHEAVWRMFNGEATDYPNLPCFEINVAAVSAMHSCRQRARVFAEAASYLEPA